MRSTKSNRFSALHGAMLACLGMLSGACASQPNRLQLLSKEAVVLSLPLPEQDEMYECGLATLEVLCEYYGVSIPAEHRKRIAATAEEREGLSGAELRAELEQLGFDVFVFEGTLDRSDTGLYKHIDEGRPLLVMTAPAPERHHYVLFLGYDEPNASVCLLDPARGRIVELRETFDQCWFACNRFTLLAVPKAKTTNEEVQP